MALKAKVAVQAIKAHKTTAQIAQMFSVHPTYQPEESALPGALAQKACPRDGCSGSARPVSLTPALGIGPAICLTHNILRDDSKENSCKRTTVVID